MKKRRQDINTNLEKEIWTKSVDEHQLKFKNNKHHEQTIYLTKLINFITRTKEIVC